MKQLFVTASLLAFIFSAFPLFADQDFFVLCEQGTAEEIAKAMEEGASLTDTREDGMTPLMVAAAFNKDPEAIDAIIKAGADIQARENKGFTPLMIAAMQNENPKIMETLIKSGGKISDHNKNGYTPLALAVQKNNTEGIEILLKAGASIHERCQFGNTPLLIAAQFDSSETTFNLLLRKGASVKDRNEFAETPLILASQNCTRPEVITALIKAGASVKEKDKWDCTPLLLATYHDNNAGVIGALLKGGSSIKERVSVLYESYEDATLGNGIKMLKNEPGWTPFMLAACFSSHPEVIDILVKAGASIEERFTFNVRLTSSTLGPLVNHIAGSDNKSNQNLTALLAAVRQTSKPEIITALLKAGANPKAKADSGENAFDLAGKNSDIKGTPEYWVLQEATYK